MVIGLRPGSPMRAIGEVDYENARIVAGRAFSLPDEGHNVAIVGKLYARERLGIADANSDPAGPALAGKTLLLNGQSLQVVGIYSTGNNFGDNHVFVPLEAFRRILKPGDKLSKSRVTVDSVDHVEAVTADLQRLKGVDAVTAAEQVATARATFGSIAAATVYGSLLLFTIGGVLVVFIMVLSTRERIREIGTLKAIGASSAEVVKQFLAEVLTLTGLGAVGALMVSAIFAAVFRSTLDVEYGYLWAEVEDEAGKPVPVVTYNVPYPPPEGKPGRRYFELIREAARQRGLPADYIAALDRVETRE